MTETRFIQATELRSISPRQIGGLAAPYNVRAKVNTKDGRTFFETIRPGAFEKVLRSKPDVVCTFNHNPDYVLGRTNSGTLRLSTDKRGLNFTCDLPDTQFARELHQSIQRQDIAGNSFQFALGPDDADYTDEFDEETRSRCVLRSIQNFSRLIDVSPVTHPAYAGTELSARCVEVSAECRSQLERRGIVIPIPSDYDLLRAQLAEVKFHEDRIAQLRAPARVKARRKFVLEQI